MLSENSNNTDLRKGIDGLAALVQQEFRLDPFTNTLFLFCGRRRDRIKAFYWGERAPVALKSRTDRADRRDGNGFVLAYKRLEQGVFQWPRCAAEVKELTSQQYRWLMEGLSVEQPKAHRDVAGLTMI